MATITSAYLVSLVCLVGTEGIIPDSCKYYISPRYLTRRSCEYDLKHYKTNGILDEAIASTHPIATEFPINVNVGAPECLTSVDMFNRKIGGIEV